MEGPTTKAEILERNRAAYGAWEAAIAGLSDEEMLAPNAAGTWSMKDVLAHIAVDDMWFSGQLGAAMRGEPPTAVDCYGDEAPPPPGIDLASNDGRNAWHYERMRNLTLEEARRMAAGATSRRDAVLAAIPEAEFEALYTIADLGHVGHLRRAVEGEQGWPLWRAIAGNAWHHYEDHTADVRAFLERRG